MTWSNWTPDEYGAQRREQVEEAANLARYLNYSDFTAEHKRQEIQAAMDMTRPFEREVAASNAASRLVHGVVEGLMLALSRLRLRFRPLQR